MRNLFTIVIERKAFDEGYFALCVELREPRGEGDTPEEAEANLIAALRRHLQVKRDEALREAAPEALVSTVIVDEDCQARAIRYDEDLILERARRITEARRKEAAGAPPPWKGTLHNEFTAVIERSEGWCVAACPEVPAANGQGRTVPDVLEDLADAIALLFLVGRESSARSEMEDAERKTVGISAGETAAVA